MKLKKQITVIIPVYNASDLLEKCLISLKNQTCNLFDVIVIDDGSIDKNVEKLSKQYFNVIRLANNVGPAKARNIGIANAKTEVIAFTDSDCEVNIDWIENMIKIFNNPEIDAIMGKVNIPQSGYIGDSISCLGFPAGGWPGYKFMYNIGPDNISSHLSTCNCAVRRNIFNITGGFDEEFPTPGREDTEFSIRLIDNKYRIKYCDNVIVSHIPRTSIKSLIKMCINRGRGTYHLKQKISSRVMNYYIKLRYKTTLLIFKKNFFSHRFPMIFFLTILSFICHYYGQIVEKRKSKKEK